MPTQEILAPSSFITQQQTPASSPYISSTARSQVQGGVTNNDSLLQIISKLQVIVQGMASNNIDRSTNVGSDLASSNNTSLGVSTTGSGARSLHPAAAANPTFPPTGTDSVATSSSNSVDSSTNIPMTQIKRPEPLSQHHLRPTVDVVHPIGTNPPSSPALRPFAPSGTVEVGTIMATDGGTLHTGTSPATLQPSGTTVHNSYSGEDRTYQLLQLLASLAPASSSSLSSSSSSALLPVSVPESQIQLDQHRQLQLERQRHDNNDNDGDNPPSNHQNDDDDVGRRQRRPPYRQHSPSSGVVVVDVAEDNAMNEYNSVTDREDETSSPHHHHYNDGTTSKHWNHTSRRQKSP